MQSENLRTSYVILRFIPFDVLQSVLVEGVREKCVEYHQGAPSHRETRGIMGQRHAQESALHGVCINIFCLVVCLRLFFHANEAQVTLQRTKDGDTSRASALESTNSSPLFKKKCGHL